MSCVDNIKQNYTKAKLCPSKKVVLTVNDKVIEKLVSDDGSNTDTHNSDDADSQSVVSNDNSNNEKAESVVHVEPRANKSRLCFRSCTCKKALNISWTFLYIPVFIPFNNVDMMMIFWV
jgi:hypothetical protein